MKGRKEMIFHIFCDGPCTIDGNAHGWVAVLLWWKDEYVLATST
jgi:ribonuclease HI